MIDIEAVFEANRDRYVAEWLELLRFPSVSTNPAHDDDCRRCADWLVSHLAEIGLESQLLETAGKPVVYAMRAGDPALPTVLLYGHYDVQPVDPLELWHSDPFEPVVRDGRLYARGAQDNKGQLFYALKALETLIAADAVGPTVKVMLEGEEECGSESVSAAMQEWTDLLAADVLLVTDVGTVRSGAPTLVMGLRGIVHLSAELSGPRTDLHSGMHGGLAPNPAAAMARIIASLHGADGGIAVPDFYDDVRDPSPRERELANAEPFDLDGYRADNGVPPVAGEHGFTPQERLGFRPCLEVNGLHSGYGGPGMKTIIPAMAAAKFSARLVPDQDPEKTLAAIVTHLEKRVPAGLSLEITDSGAAGVGFRLNLDSALVQRAVKVLDGLTDRKTAFLWEGAAIPLITELSRVSGAEPLLCGFGSHEDNIHAPNESFALDRFRLGYLYVAWMLEELGV